MLRHGRGGDREHQVPDGVASRKAGATDALHRHLQSSMRDREVVDVVRGPDGGPYSCPCCGYLTLRQRGAFQICQVCFWEDDGQDEHDAEVVRGGPNGTLSLRQARSNFLV